MRKLLLVVMLCLAGLGYCLSSHGGAPPEGSQELPIVPEVVSSPNVVGSSASRRETVPVLRLVDCNTNKPLVNTLVRISMHGNGGEHLDVKTSVDGEVPVSLGMLRVAPVDGFSFSPLDVSVSEAHTSIKVDGRCRVIVRGGVGVACAFHELLPDDAVGDVVDGPEGLKIGRAVLEWADDKWHEMPTATGWHVVVAARGVIAPAHPVWAGKVTQTSSGRNTFQFPVASSVPRVSAVVGANLGESYEFTLDAVEESASVTYWLDTPCGKTCSVELMRLDTVAGGNRVVHVVSRQRPEAGSQEVLFSKLQAGQYVVRSMVVTGQDLRLAWQRVDLEVGEPWRMIERDGWGKGVVRVGEEFRDMLMVHLNCGVMEGVPVNYGSIELSGISFMRGLMHPVGSVRLFSRKDMRDMRVDFDTEKSARLHVTK